MKVVLDLIVVTFLDRYARKPITPLPLVAALLGITGIAEIVTRTRHESQSKRSYLVKEMRNMPSPRAD